MNSLDRRSFLAGSAGLGALLAAPAIVRAQSTQTLNLYSSRHYDTDEALYQTFTAATGIRVNRVEAAPDALIERMRAEGANSPADVFISVDAGRIERARELGLLAPINSEALVSRVPANLRDPDGHWFGVSTRARVIMYHKDRVNPSQLSTYEDLADPKWRGKVLMRSSTNIYSQSMTGAILAANGEAATEAWCRGIVANFTRQPRGGDTDQIRAAFAGEGDLAISNTYYLGNIIRKSATQDAALIDKIGVFFPNQGNRGSHVNISGVALCATAKNREAGIRFMEHLISPAAQRFLAEGNDEYPVVDGVAPPPTIARFGAFKSDTINARVFARNNAQALQIMDRAGWK
ncbi:MAG: Fe(3+) ABC transporter substrate-binding protein [Bosea sp.]|nr:Fe(3+) ABC transporter substrate-binding protein [Bosea sp. (in: a-proteobacteria)]